MSEKDFAKSLWNEYRKEKKKNEKLEEEVLWLKKVLKLALGDRVIVVREKEIDSMGVPVFDLSENLENDLLIRIFKKG